MKKIIIALLVIVIGIATFYGYRYWSNRVPPEFNLTEDNILSKEVDENIAFGLDNKVYEIIETFKGKDYNSIEKNYYKTKEIDNIIQKSDKYLLTSSGNLYWYSEGGGNELKMEGVQEFKVGGVAEGTVFALTDEGDLYGFGENSYNEVGNGEIRQRGVKDPYLILSDVKSYFLVNSEGPNEEQKSIAYDDTFFMAAALTNTGELYTWAPKGSVKTQSNLIKETNYMKLQMENIKDFQITNDGLVAQNNEGENLTIKVEQTAEEEYYVNYYYLDDTSWDPIFDKYLLSLSTTTNRGNSIRNIQGKLKNDSNESWESVQLVFALYNSEGKFRGNSLLTVGPVKSKHEIDFITENIDSTKDEIDGYEIVEITPLINN